MQSIDTANFETVNDKLRQTFLFFGFSFYFGLLKSGILPESGFSNKSKTKSNGERGCEDGVDWGDDGEEPSVDLSAMSRTKVLPAPSFLFSMWAYARGCDIM